jgi:hypothetical protein
MPAHRTTDSEFSSLPTPATSEPGFTVSPVDKDGQPTNNPNERWYHPETGRLLQKGISQVLRENELLGTVTTATSGRSPEFRKGSNPNPVEFVEDLLRTPAASEAERGHQPEDKSKARGGQVTLSGQMMTYFPTPNTMDHLPARTAEQKEKNKGKGGYANVRETVVNDLMPTPTTMDAKATNDYDTAQKFLSQGRQTCLTYELIPTPTTRDHKDGSEPHKRDGVVQTDTVARAVFNSGEVLLPTTRTSMKNGATAKEVAAGNPKFRLEAVTNWGKFEPAIKRWEETLGRPAPAPTKPDGKEGGHRLSSAFTEWMMGVPEGWITDCGLSRNDELKACGNGVVPQQAELALRVLLQGITLPAGGGK